MRDVLHGLLQSLDDQRPTAYCRLVATRGSTPQKAGAMMLVFGGGDQAGTLGGGCVEAEVKRRALAILTVSDHLQTGEALPADQRERSFGDMVEIALNAAFDSRN